MRPLDDWRSAAQFMTFGNLKAAWWSTGENADEKPWLLLIHGYPTSSWDWTPMWEALSAHFRLAAVDMIGFGLSDKPPKHRYSIFEQADLQESLLEYLGISEAHLLVHDYGNTVAQELIARQAETSLSFLIRSCVFLNGGLFPEMHRARLSQKLGLTPLGALLGAMMSKDRLRTAFDEIFGPDTKASDDEISGHFKLIRENNGLKVLHKALQYIPERRAHRARWVGGLQQTHLPMRLINGGADPVSGAHLYHYYKEQIPNADAVLFDELGHYPHTEGPDQVLAAFLEFHRNHKTIA